jgi:peptidyl-prolyl cis-trans isomerase D
MITWIQIRIQKHLRLLFMALLVIMVVTFVLTIGNQSFFGSHNNNQFKTKDFYGYNLASENTKAYLEHSAQLSAMLSQELMMGPNHIYPIERYGNERAAALAMAQQLGIRAPTEDQIRAYIRTKPIFQDEAGKFSAKTYKAVIEILATRQRISEDSILNVLSEDWRIAKVRSLLGGAGFITPDIIAIQRQSVDTEWTFSVANVSLDAFKPHFDPTAAELEKFYNDNKARFEIPEKLQLVQARFPAVAYVASVAMPTKEEVQAVFERNKAHYAPTAATPGPDGKVPEATLDDATRARVVQDIVQSKAVQLAASKADEYTVALWRENASTATTAQHAAELAKSMGAQISAVAPFAKGNPPHSQDIGGDQIDQLWTLATSERSFSDVIPSKDGASVFIFQGTIAARMPAFSEIQKDVAQAYEAERRASLFAEHGADLRKQLAASVAKGQGFADAARALGLTVEEHPAVKISNATQELMVNGGPLDVATRLKAGSVSAMQMTPKGGFIVYLQDKKMPAIDAVRGKPEEVAQIRNTFATADGWEVLGALSEKRLAELDAEVKGSAKSGD